MKNNLTFLTFKALYPHQSLYKFLVFRALEPMIHYMFFAIIAMSILGKEYIEFILIGNIIFYIATTNIMTFIMIFKKERNYGTLEYNVSSPTSMLELIFKRSLISVVDSFFIFLVSSTFVYLFLDFKVSLENILYIVFNFLVILFTLISFALIVASFGLVLRNVNLYINAVLGCLQVFCGINFPTHLLPDFLEKASHLLPITNGLIALRGLVNGESYSDLSHYIWYELSIGTLLLAIGVILIKFMEKIALQNGSLLKSN